MKLNEFINETINQIINALENIEKTQDRTIYLKSPTNESVSFDLAIIVEESKKSGAEIKIMNFLGGGVSGNNKTSTANRVQFSVYVDNKTKTKKEEERRELANLNARF